MIKWIEIKNFQSHKATKIKLAKGITAITGIPLAGKTAIARALQWNVFNRPSGMKIKSNFSSSTEATEVTIRTDENTVTHRRTKTENQYLLDGRKFSKIGTNVPDLVKSALNLDEINIQNQLDQHYLITSTPGQVTREINKIIGADRADLWIKKLTTKINSLNSLLKINKQNKKDAMEKLKKYKIISQLVLLHKKAKGLQDEVFVAESRNDQIQTLLDDYSQLTQWLNNAQVAMRAEGDIDKAEALQRENNNLNLFNQRLADFITLKSLIKDCQDDFQRTKARYIEAMEQAGICPTCFSDIDRYVLGRIVENL